MKIEVKKIEFINNTLALTLEKNNIRYEKTYVYNKKFFDDPLIKEITEEKNGTQMFFPCAKNENEIILIVYENLSKNIIDLIYKKYKMRLVIFYSNKNDFIKSLEKFYEIEKKFIIDGVGEVFESVIKNEYNYDSEDIYSDIGSVLSVDSPIVIKGITAIIHHGIKVHASDIHIEPYKNYVRVRYRIDGVLIENRKISVSLLNPIISRLKIMADLDITERRLPQDGKFQLFYEKNKIDFRLSIIFTINGEKAVIRILDQSATNIDLENLGLSQTNYSILLNEINKSKGTILISGPTGSGKSSTLYAILKNINNGEKNISTVEDPVEYQLEGINQVQYNNDIGLNFSVALRSFLRQDPDVIMVGEIRDQETAEIAIKAAMTGHLVLSTIHTNDSIGGIFRLINLGIKAYMISGAVNLIISQRLVRKLCDKCKIIDKDHKHKLELLGIENKENLINFYTKKGCPECNNTGYKGRVGIFEFFRLNEKIKESISNNASLEEIRKMAKENGMRSLIEEGVKKAKEGIISLDEIIRECQ